ncbi:phage holin, lambda family [Entomomonas sp. E2T0]|uniref:phage holin, lambda family n=1 Tax=Entomomonas sp. E2T0 TaxID=2930213 RepID=UPI0022281D92|nr:phage holin, lambda family [Entomomonas sp. E2T0]UYZ83186.1 phage holin, lambda family [Entomomonas sp. E2T0]
MPNKDPNLWNWLIAAIEQSPTIQGAVMAAIMAILRLLYDENETKPIRIALEAVTCGAMSLCITSIVEIFNLPQSAVITIGGAIGFIGVTALRNFILKAINKRIDKE